MADDGPLGCVTIASPADSPWLSQRPGQEAACAPQRDSGGTARMLMLCPAQGLGLAFSRAALAEAHPVTFGGGKEWGGGWEMASFSTLSHL